MGVGVEVGGEQRLSALVEAARGGDRTAFDQIDALCRPGVERVLRSRGVHRPEDLADLSQEVLFMAWQRLGQLRDPSSFRSWLWAIARRVASAQAQRSVERETVELVEQAASGDGPDLTMELRDLADLVTTAVHGLNERDRLALTLISVGFQPMDFTAAMGVSANTAKQIAKRARDRLRDAMRVELSLRRRESGCAVLAKLIDNDRTVDAARHARTCEVCEAAEADLQLYQLSPETPDGP